MRKFKCSLGEVVDLDDINTYSHLPNTIDELRKLMFQEIGYAYCYMNYWYSDVFNRKDIKQKKHVKKLIKTFTENSDDNRDNIMWYKEQVFLFQDEIENMC